MKQRTTDETKLAFACIAVLLQHVRPGNVGRHQVRSKLYPSKVQRQTTG